MRLRRPGGRGAGPPPGTVGPESAGSRGSAPSLADGEPGQGRGHACPTREPPFWQMGNLRPGRRLRGADAPIRAGDSVGFGLAPLRFAPGGARAPPSPTGSLGLQSEPAGGVSPKLEAGLKGRPAPAHLCGISGSVGGEWGRGRRKWGTGGLRVETASARALEIKGWGGGAQPGPLALLPPTSPTSPSSHRGPSCGLFAGRAPEPQTEGGRARAGRQRAADHSRVPASRGQKAGSLFGQLHHHFGIQPQARAGARAGHRGGRWLPPLLLVHPGQPKEGGRSSRREQKAASVQFQ